jgi:hypothetical protein
VSTADTFLAEILVHFARFLEMNTQGAVSMIFSGMERLMLPGSRSHLL